MVLLACTAMVHRDSSWLYLGGGFTVVGLASVLLLASLLDAEAPLARAFSWRPAVCLGRASYSLYLWHVPAFVVVADRLSDQPTGIRLVLGLTGCALATMASYQLVEMPVMRLRGRFAVAPRVSELAPEARR